MTFEYDPLVVLQNEILKTREVRLNPKPVKHYRFRLDDDNYVNDSSDQEFINQYISMSEFFPEK